MSRRPLLWVVAAATISLLLVVLVPVASGSDGRADKARPGPAAPAAPTPGGSTFSGHDGDGPAPRDQVFLDDLIVDGSACVGIDCADGEAFGFATLKLKENNLRLVFEDTSNSSAFPTRDWQIEANGSNDGSDTYLRIVDCGTAYNGASDCSGTPVFTVEGGARANALFVEDSGEVGFGTASPVADLHVLVGDSPTLRLEQDGSSGFTAQTWDLAGNEANFFLRDANTGNLPFRVLPGAPGNALVVEGSGEVGIGTSTPDSTLTLRAAAPTIGLDGTGSGKMWRIQLTQNSGNLHLVPFGGGATFRFRIDGGFEVVQQGVNNKPLVLDPAGNLTIGGALTENSDRAAKVGFQSVDSEWVLQQVVNLPLSTWSYVHDASGIRHLGPMAQDFHAAFGLGAGPNGVSTLDMSGVALASIQALAAENADLRSRVEALEAQVAALLAALED